MSNPFRTVTARTGRTHLVAISPAIPGTDPTVLPNRALCGAAPHAFSTAGPGDVECTHCLNLAPRYMGLAGFTQPA